MFDNETIADYINPFRFLGFSEQERCFNATAFNEYCLGILSFYKKNGLFKRIVDIPADNATRNGITVNAKYQIEIEKMLNDLNYKKHLSTAIKQVRLYGGCLVVFNIDDGQYNEDKIKEGKKIIDYSKEVDCSKIKEVSFGGIYPITEFKIKYDDDCLGDYYFSIEQKKDITKPQQEKKEDIIIHKTRAIFITNDNIAFRYDELFSLSTSIFFRCFIPISRYEQVLEATCADAMNSQIGVLKVDMTGDVAATKNNDEEEELRKKLINTLNFIQLATRRKRKIVIDKNDEYNVLSSSLSGYAPIIDALSKDVASSCDISMAVLFGEKQSGLSNDGSKDLEVFYNMIKTIQENYLREVLNYLIKLVNNCVINNKLFKDDKKEISKKEDEKKEGMIEKIKNFFAKPVNQIIENKKNKQAMIERDEEIKFEFNELWQLSELDKAKIDNINMQTFIGYKNGQVITAEEIRNQSELNKFFNDNDNVKRDFLQENSDKIGDFDKKKDNKNMSFANKN